MYDPQHRKILANEVPAEKTEEYISFLQKVAQSNHILHNLRTSKQIHLSEGVCTYLIDLLTDNQHRLVKHLEESKKRIHAYCAQLDQTINQRQDTLDKLNSIRNVSTFLDVKTTTVLPVLPKDSQEILEEFMLLETEKSFYISSLERIQSEIVDIQKQLEAYHNKEALIIKLTQK